MKDRTRASVKQPADVLRNQIGTQDEHRAAGIIAGKSRHRLIHAHQRVDLDLQILDVGCGAFVEDHQIDSKLLQPPVFMRPQQLTYEFQLFWLCDADQDDGQIAGDSLRPQRRGPPHATFQVIRSGSQGRVGIKEVVGEALKQVRLVRIDSQMVKLHLCLCPGKGTCSLERHCVVMLVGEIYHVIARCCRDGPERNPHSASTRNRYAPAKAEDRIEYRTRCIGQWPSLRHRGGRTNGLPPTKKPGSIGLELHLARSFSLHHSQMCSPHLRVARRTLAAGRQNGAQLSHKLGFHEQF